MIYSINEIFESIQGEGTWTGSIATFIRFSGCNGLCAFCDTNHEENLLLDPEQLKFEIKKLANRRVILTGGEPVLQLDRQLIEVLNERFILLETNGSLPIEGDIFKALDWVTVSPKKGLPLELKRAHDLKIVWDGETDPMEYDSKGDWFRKCVQPEWSKWKQHLPDIISFLKKHQDWSLSLQTHKLMGIP